ncbi:MAG: hypothetical protein H6933_11015 [Burkholderiaceae bacterium]|nr:hypothetical protein [Burkholderiaceae bacterium]
MTTGVTCLRYLDDVELEAVAYVSFLQAGSQVFTMSRWVQEGASFLDVDRPVALPSVLPYESFFLALERHGAFTVWDSVRPGESVDGCFVRRLPGGELELYFTLRGEQSATGLPGVGLTLTPADVMGQRSVRNVVEAALRNQQQVLAQVELPKEPFHRQQVERQQAQTAAAIELQTTGRLMPIAYAVNRVLKLLEKFAELQRQDRRPQWMRPRTAAERRKDEAREMRAAPRPPHAVKLSLTAVPGAPEGFGHYRVQQEAPLPHWRRAHWRDQPCGPGRAERRRVLIEPTRVGTPGLAGARTYAVQP